MTLIRYHTISIFFLFCPSFFEKRLYLPLSFWFSSSFQILEFTFSGRHGQVLSSSPLSSAENANYGTRWTPERGQKQSRFQSPRRTRGSTKQEVSPDSRRYRIMYCNKRLSVNLLRLNIVYWSMNVAKIVLKKSKRAFIRTGYTWKVSQKGQTLQPPPPSLVVSFPKNQPGHFPVGKSRTVCEKRQKNDLFLHNQLGWSKSSKMIY